MGSYGDKMERSEAIMNKLEELDVMCELNSVRAQILLLGGASLMLLMEMHSRKFRPTRDIDVSLLSTTDEKKIRKILQELAIDVLDGIVEVPPLEDFREKEKLKIEGAGFQNIEVFVPTLELLACTKIFSKREKDLQDLQVSDILLICEKEILLEMVDEYKDYLINPNDPDLNYHQLVHILKKKGI